ncbi:MAG: O-methyltransferase [bacterium]|nr:O-methyltransferase [bacterium]
MQFWRFLAPSALGWTLRQGRDFIIDRLRGAPPRPLQARDYVAAHAKQGDPDDVLRTLDRFARDTRFLMNVGPEKGPLLFELIARLPRPARVLELGAFCGYSAIMITNQLGPGSSLVSVEKSPEATEASRDNVAIAGLAEQVEIIEGSSSDRIPTLEGPFHLVFLDHWKDLYLPDLKLLEAHQLLAPGCIVMADNVGPLFGAEPYLSYVRSCGRYDSENRPAKLEYSDLPDAVEISVWKGEAG